MATDKDIEDAGKGLFVVGIKALTEFFEGKAAFVIATGSADASGVVRRSITFRRFAEGEAKPSE